MTIDEAIKDIKDNIKPVVGGKSLDMAIEALERQRWVPCGERLPEEEGDYLTTTMYGDVFCDYWNGLNFNRTEMVTAWMPLPEPYQEGGEE